MIYFFAAFFGLLNSLYIFNQFQSYQASEWLITILFGRDLPNAALLMNLVMYYAPAMVFVLFKGAEIYRHFCTASIYYFSRCPERRKWFTKEVLRLLPAPFLYMIIYIGTPAAAGLLTGSLVMNKDFAPLFFWSVLVWGLWLLFWLLATNILSIFMGGYKGFLAGAAVQALMLASLLAFGEGAFLDLSSFCEERLAHAGYLWLFPAAHLFIGWHSSQGISCLNALGISFPLGGSCLEYFLMALCVFAVGYAVIGRVELIEESKDTE